GDPVEDRLPQLGVRALAPAEHDRDLDLVTALEEPANVVDLRLVVVVVDLHAELDRLHLLLAGALARLLHLLLLLEAVATVIRSGVPVEDRLPQLGVRALAPAEHDRDLDLVTALEEPANVVDLRLVVVVVDLHAELDRLHLLLAGALARLLHLLLLLEAVATVIEELGDRRLRGLAHQYEVEVFLPGTPQRVPRVDDADL